MIDWKKALNLILTNTAVLKEEKTDIIQASGMILSEDICSTIEMPPFDKSAVDGYAVNTQDIKNMPTRLMCIGTIQAGDNFTKEVKHSQCVKIMTGAPIPKGANAVVMIENTSSRDSHIKINAKVAKGDNICLLGEDIKKGQLIARKETVIFPSHISLLAAAGKKYVRVRQKPKAAVLNTGGEIIPTGNRLSKNKIYNSNGPQLLALLKNDGLEPVFSGIVKDDCEKLAAVIRQGLKNDILLISGGVSMGDYDLIPKVLKKLGVKEIFHKVKIKPGKPLFFGVKGKTLVFGIPGNPVSNFLVYQIFIRPAIYKMMGYKNSGNIFKRGVLKKDFFTKSERTHFVVVNIVVKENKYYLNTLNSHGSADILALANADGFIVIEPTKRYIAKKNVNGFYHMEKYISPDYLRLSVTDHCNLNCLYCTPLWKSQFLSRGDILRYEEMTRLANLFVKAGVKKIRITGGEPLIRKNITALIKMLNDIEELQDLSLTTNGVYLKDFAASLKKYGLDRVNISLDTLNKQRFKKITGMDCFKDVWQGIFTALKVGLHPVKLNVITMRGINDDEIAEFARLTLNYDIIVRFIELFPTNRRLKTIESYFIGSEETKAIIEKGFSSLTEAADIRGNGPAQYYKLFGSKGAIGFISSYTKNFCNDCNRLRLDCVGRVSPCLFSGHTCDLKTLIRGNKSDEEILACIKDIFASKRMYRKDFNNREVEMSSIGG